jgi:hypothetical protein
MNYDATEADKDNKGFSALKRVLIFVIAPAAIAGFFSVAPKLYDEYTKPVATLSYSLVSGPALASEAGNRRIFAVIFENSGKTSLTNVEANLHLSSGQIETIGVEKKELHPEVSSKQADAHVSVNRMLPADRVTVSILAVASAEAPLLDIALRSSEVIGIPANRAEDAELQGRLMTIGATLSALSVAVTSILILSLRSTKSSLATLLRGAPNYRLGIITIIVGLSRVFENDEATILNKAPETYAHLADLFLIHGIRGNDTTRHRCILALWALLMVDKMMEESLIIVRANLKQLGIELNDTDFKALRKKAASFSNDELRREIITLLTAETTNVAASATL